MAVIAVTVGVVSQAAPASAHWLHKELWGYWSAGAECAHLYGDMDTHSGGYIATQVRSKVVKLGYGAVPNTPCGNAFERGPNQLIVRQDLYIWNGVNGVWDICNQGAWQWGSGIELRTWWNYNWACYQWFYKSMWYSHVGYGYLDNGGWKGGSVSAGYDVQP